MHDILKHWILRLLIVMTSVVITALAVLVSVMYFVNGTATTLPAPTGNFTVGRTSFVVADSATAGETSHHNASAGKLYVWAWYPAMANPAAATASYMPRTWRAALDANSGWIMTHLINRNLALVKTHSILNAPLSTAKALYPVILLRAGSSALTINYTVLAEDLASHGYVVIGIDAPFRSFVVVYPDGQVVARADRNNPEVETLSSPEPDETGH